MAVFPMVKGVPSGGGYEYTNVGLGRVSTFGAADTYTFTENYDEVWIIVSSSVNRKSVMLLNGVASTFPEIFDETKEFTLVKFENVKANDVFGPYGFGSNWPTTICGFNK